MILRTNLIIGYQPTPRCDITHAKNGMVSQNNRKGTLIRDKEGNYVRV